MHIAEGVLSGPVLITGAALAAAGTAVGLKKMDMDRTPQVAILSASFFVASLIHVPVGLSSSHLILNGLLGLLLGWAAFPAILIALLLQAILFQYGGLTTLGVNTLNMALPAVVCPFIFGALARSSKSFWSMIGAFLIGATSVLLAGLLTGLSLYFSGESFWAAAWALVAAHIPVMLVEGVITAASIQFLKKVKPEILEVAYAR